MNALPTPPCRVVLPDGKVVPLGAGARAAVLAAVHDMASEGLRCLALANKVGLCSGHVCCTGPCVVTQHISRILLAAGPPIRAGGL